MNEDALIDDNQKFFENLPDLIRAENLASLMGLSVKTIYDWRYRARIRRVPAELFLKFRGKLFVRTKVLKQWMASECS